MKFGLFTHVPWPEGTNAQQVFHEATEEVLYGGELGFHSAWVAEHHFSRYGIGSSSLVLAASIAGQSKKIRLGTAVLVPPLHNPIRLAEDTATLDAISGGRLDVGFGRGTAGYEYRGYNVDREESQGRFQESIKVIQGLWTTPDYSHQGQYYQVHRANLTPLPVQQPHPPIYLAATRTPETLEFAASSGHTLMIGVVLDTVDALDLCHRFVAMSRQAGHDNTMGQIPFFRYCYVAETEQQAREEAAVGLRWTMDMIQWRRTVSEGSEVHHRLDDWRANRTELPPEYDYLHEHRAVIGDPEQCVAKLKELEKERIGYFGCNFSFGGMQHADLMRSMKLFAKEVMPHFK